MSVVFLCVGAAKAGTSWLYHQLSQHPQCHFRAIKELHYFDALAQGKLNDQLQKHIDQQRSVLDRLATEGRAPDADQADRLADRAHWIDVLETKSDNLQGYLDYLHHGGEDQSIVGEMTPAYALLPEENLSAMAKMAPDVRFLYLLRDPVDRLWSHVRMIAARRDPSGQPTPRRCARILARTISGEETQILRRADYAGAIRRLAAAVPAPKLLIEVFEDLVQGDGLSRICDFLGISRMTPDFSPVHAGHPVDMTIEQKLAARAWLAPQYDAAERALGRMPDAWAAGEVR